MFNPELDEDEEQDDPYGLGGINMEVEHEYHFNRLLDDPPNERPNHHYLFGMDEEDDIGPEEEDPDNALYNADFGLPDDGNPMIEDELPRFQLGPEDELDEQFDPLPDEDPDDVGDPEALCAAFQEHELIRNAYIDAFIQKYLYGATHRALKHQLKAARRTIAANPNVDPEHIADMAQTIGTAENRLGVNTNSIITTFTLCPVCRRRYSPEYIAATDNDACLNEDCEGTLFTRRKLASGSQRRVSTMTYPFASPIAWLRHMLSLPGVSELMQNWRDGDNDQGLSAPITGEEWMRDVDIDKPIGDISEGWGWRSTLAGLERRRDPRTGNIVDKSVLEQPIRFVSLPFGISFSLNTDWLAAFTCLYSMFSTELSLRFQATKEGNYSVGACYLAINNLPRHMRFLRENISLCIVMPGPNEPDEYGLDQMLEPLIEEMLQLKQGAH